MKFPTNSTRVPEFCTCILFGLSVTFQGDNYQKQNKLLCYDH